MLEVPPYMHAGGAAEERETEMMSVRWNEFDLRATTQGRRRRSRNGYDVRSLEWVSLTSNFHAVGGGAAEVRETEMMLVRCNEFGFRYKIAAAEQVCVPPCGHCFSVFIIINLK